MDYIAIAKKHDYKNMNNAQKRKVAQKDRNGKAHYIAVENMELAKKLYGSAPKRELTLIKGE